MKPFADANFFTNLWLDLTHSAEAEALLNRLYVTRGTLPVTPLLRLETINAFQRLVFESRQGIPLVRVSPEAALVADATFQEELWAGRFVEWRAIDPGVLEEAFETLAHRHTARHGFRTYDILHVASALVLGCDMFWSFDIRAKKLAKLEGLQTN